MRELLLSDVKEYGLVFLLIATLFIFVYKLTKSFSRYNFPDHLGRSLSNTAFLPLMHVQAVEKVYNPFALHLLDSRKACVKDGAVFSVTSSIPCWLGIFWGTKIEDLYHIIYASWPSFQDFVSFKLSLRNISQQDEEVELLDVTKSKAITIKAHSVLDLGHPPRNRYPLVLILLDLNALNCPWSEVQYLQQIVCMVAIVHLRDEDCPRESHIFSQLVRCPLGRPCDLKQLYMSGTEGSDTQPLSSNNYMNRSSFDGIDTPIPLCSVCQEAPVEQAILPCRHACTCTECCVRLINCPICRAFIISTFPLDSM